MKMSWVSLVLCQGASSEKSIQVISGSAFLYGDWDRQRSHRCAIFQYRGKRCAKNFDFASAANPIHRPFQARLERPRTKHSWHPASDERRAWPLRATYAHSGGRAPSQLKHCKVHPGGGGASLGMIAIFHPSAKSLPWRFPRQDFLSNSSSLTPLVGHFPSRHASVLHTSMFAITSCT